jgi:SAM-dependent methyltransferase
VSAVPSTVRARSPELDEYNAAFMHRPLICDFVGEQANGLSRGTRVLDVGAGTAPYRELFGHCDYRTSEWEDSYFEEGLRSDVIGPAHNLPLSDASVDAIVLTEVLEHVPDPGDVLAEMARLLAPGGRLIMTTPFVWPLHMQPHDYFRYTPAGLRSLLEPRGFEGVDVRPLGGYFTMLGQTMRNGVHSFGGERPSSGFLLWGLAVALNRTGRLVGRLDRVDRRRDLPVGWATLAVRRSVEPT